MESEWESHKETIRRLYLEEDKTRCEVMRAMENKFDFRAEAGKYERQFRKWNFRKNLNEKEWRAVVRRINKRKAQGKESQLRIDGILVTAKKLKKATARYQDSKLDTIKRCRYIIPVISVCIDDFSNGNRSAQQNTRRAHNTHSSELRGALHHT
ncbi:hypothetical protein SLS56_005787 [Neofusicoccum ribis]|uniref:Clr5 domain-containing protein n=1 Tax=Neofusicoccum ribis TaxID=45134 RepID=A0ABR3SSG1_9PEZI